MICKKNFYANKRNINQWIKKFLSNNRDNELCAICTKGTDFQNSNFCNIDSWDNIKGIGNAKGITKFSVNKYNLFPVCVYFAVRHAIKPKWTNDRDQFLYPNKKWHDDKEFHYDCLAFALFHNQNRISAKIATNHLIPFSESEVGASGAFKSDFMTRFINGKVVNGTLVDCFIPTQKIAFSNEAEAVFSAGRELWRYYHKCAKNSDSYLNDANLYDIREFFQKRDKLNKLNAKSDDSHYNDLIAELRITLQNLADKITPKIYEYEFLQE